jgi:hypothetical protein
MTVLAVCADVHVGNHTILGGPSVNGLNERCRRIIAVLRKAAETAAECGATFVIAGDLFDTPKPSPQMVRAVMDAISVPRAARATHGWWTIVLVGNHDRVTDAPGDHACAPLGALPNVRVVDSVESIDGVLYIPPPPRGTPGIQWFRDALEKHSLTPDERTAIEAKPGVIVAHFGIHDEATATFKVSPAALNQHEALAYMSEYNYSRMLSGDWHERRVWRGQFINRQDWGRLRPPRGGAPDIMGIHKPFENRIDQIGALVPTGWDNPGEEYGFLTIVDTTDPTLGSVGGHTFKVVGPRFVDATSPFEAAKARDGGHYVRLHGPRGMQAPEGVLFVEDSIKAARSVADIKKSTASSFDDAVSLAVDEMIKAPLRDEVLAMAMNALQQSGSL